MASLSLTPVVPAALTVTGASTEEATVTAVAGDVTRVVAGVAGQSADLQQYRDSAGYVQARFDKLGRLRLAGDSGESTGDGDPIALVTLENRTAYPFDGGTPGYGPGINWLVNGEYRWQTGLDAAGIDFVVAYHKGTTEETLTAGGAGPATGLSRDVLYVTGEDFPRIGITYNSPSATLHVPTLLSGRPALVVDNQVASGFDDWLLELKTQGTTKGGFWLDQAAGLVKLGVGMTTEPADLVEAAGRVRAQGFRVVNAETAAVTGLSHPLIYSTANPGAGTDPFDVNGNLVLQPRSDAALYDVCVATGSPPAVRLQVYADGGVMVGATSGKVGFYGTAPVARQTLATGAEATVDNVITALQNLGLVKQS